MALVKCKECGHDVSTSAEKCTNCGKARTSATTWHVVLFCLAFALLVTYCSRDSNQAGKQTYSAEKLAKPDIRPEMIVKPKDDGAYGCVTRDGFLESLRHALNKETTKFAAMFTNMQCLPLYEKVEYRVLSVDGIIVEVTAANTGFSDGLWSSSAFFKPQ
jgi:hypothetical protein